MKEDETDFSSRFDRAWRKSGILRRFSIEKKRSGLKEAKRPVEKRRKIGSIEFRTGIPARR